MINYEEEQCNEIEALESIYPNEFEILDTTSLYKFRITVNAEYIYTDEEKKTAASIALVFQYTKEYPDELPLIEISPVDNIEDEDLDDLRSLLNEQCSENLGVVMIFTLVSFSQEWLNSFLECIEEKQREEKLRIKRKLEEAERKRLEGTKVTVESFLTWKAKFELELVSLNVQKEKEDGKLQRLTGRELFLKDKTLDQSDLSFLGEGEEIAVDESLFQDLDDLDLEDEFHSDLES